MRRDKEFYIRLGWALKSQRELKKISVFDTAKELEITHQQVRKYESGENRIPVDKLERFCDLMQIKSTWIIEWAKKVEVIE